MDKKKIGKTIAYLRKRAGFTQKDLADRIGISDKAVSKWERGLGTPDIAYFGKLSILLDTDIDSILTGNVIHHDKEWRGLLVLPENVQGVNAGMVIYDKPLVYFLLSYYLLVGIKHIYIVSNKTDSDYILEEFGDGGSLGIKLEYIGTRFDDVTNALDSDSSYSNLMVVYGRSFIFGVDQTRFFQRAMINKDRMTILSLPKKTDKAESSVLSFDEARKLVHSDSEERIHTQYDYYEIPVLFCPKEKLPQIYKASDQGKFLISLSDFEREQLYTEVLDRGFVEMPIDNLDQALDVADFVRLVQYACGMEIYCIEEIAWRRGMINLEQLREFGIRKGNTNYGRYLLSLSERYNKVNVNSMENASI